MMSVILWFIVLYLLYKFIFGFVIPVISAARTMRKKVKDMQQQMNGYNTTSTQQTTNTTKPPHSNTTSTSGEYIDFEEVK